MNITNCTSSLISYTNQQFNPKTISGLQLWLDASSTNNFSFTGSSQSVLSWTDLSGNNRNATPFVLANTLPTWVTSGLNTKPSVSFTNLGSGFASFMSPGTTNNAITIFVVYVRTGTSTFTTLINRTFSSLPRPFDPYTTTRFIGGITGSTASAGNATSSFNISTDSNTNIYIASAQQLSWSEWVNSTQQTIANTTFLTVFNDIGATGLFVGTRSDKVTSFAGNMSEILLYNEYLSTTNRQKIESYLKTKWGFSYSGLSTVSQYYTLVSGTQPTTANTSSYQILTCTSNCTIRLSYPVGNISFLCVGGGGGGKGGTLDGFGNIVGNGGNGGVNALGVWTSTSIPSYNISVVVGSGGGQSANGNSSSISIASSVVPLATTTILSCPGGISDGGGTSQTFTSNATYISSTQGGSGGGGGNVSAGTSSATTFVLPSGVSGSIPTKFSGGGGAGKDNGSSANGGGGGGGNNSGAGGGYGSSGNINGVSGSVYGGGGGGGGAWGDINTGQSGSGAAGASGVVYIYFPLA